MHVIAELTIVPVVGDSSVADYIKACKQVLDERGITHEMHANGTNLEGDFDAVTEAIRACHEKLHNMGAARLVSSVHFYTRTDKQQSLANKRAKVRDMG